MADRGFNIQEMLASKGVKVNVPPFMNQSGQFTEQEMLATRRIATLRIHVERAIEYRSDNVTKMNFWKLWD